MNLFHTCVFFMVLNFNELIIQMKSVFQPAVIHELFS